MPPPHSRVVQHANKARVVTRACARRSSCADGSQLSLVRQASSSSPLGIFSSSESCRPHITLPMTLPSLPPMLSRHKGPQRTPAVTVSLTSAVLSSTVHFQPGRRCLPPRVHLPFRCKTMAPTPLTMRLTSLFSSSLLLPTLLSPPSIPPTSPLAIANSATACAVATALTRLTAVAHASSLRTPAASTFINHRITSPKTPKPKRIAAGMAQSATTASTATAARSPSSVSSTDTCPPPS